MKASLMENRQVSSITKFDTLYTTNHIQILKILMPFFEPSLQKQIAICIKYLEFKITFDIIQKNIKAPFPQISLTTNLEPLCDEIFTFLEPTEQETLSQIKSGLKSFQDMQETIEIFHMMQETMSEEDMKEFMKGQFNFF